jgi:hypothetical protein
MDINQVIDNSYFKEGLRKSSEILQRETDYFLKSGLKREFSKSDSQILDEFKFLPRLLDLLEDLSKISDLFLHYEPRDWLSKKEVSDLDTVRLFTEFTLNKIFAIRDLLIQIINQSFRIGKPEKNLKWIDVQRDKSFLNSKTHEIFQNFFNEFEDLFKIRNQFIHEADYVDSEYDELFGVYFINRHSFHSSEGVDERLRESMPFNRTNIDKLKRDRYAMLLKLEQRVFFYVHGFLSSLPIRDTVAHTTIPK